MALWLFRENLNSLDLYFRKLIFGDGENVIHICLVFLLVPIAENVRCTLYIYVHESKTGDKCNRVVQALGKHLYT